MVLRRPGRWIAVPAFAALVCWLAPEAAGWRDWLALTAWVGLVAVLSNWVKAQGLGFLANIVGIVTCWVGFWLWQAKGRIGLGVFIGGFFLSLALLGTYFVRRAEIKARTEGSSSVSANRSLNTSS